MNAIFTRTNVIITCIEKNQAVLTMFRTDTTSQIFACNREETLAVISNMENLIANIDDIDADHEAMLQCRNTNKAGAVLDLYVNQLNHTVEVDWEINEHAFGHTAMSVADLSVWADELRGCLRHIDA